MLLLAGIWESNVREEKDENANNEKESKQAAQNQLHFPFHLRMMTVTMVEMIKWMATVAGQLSQNRSRHMMKTRPCILLTIFAFIIINSIVMIDITAEMKGMLM